ncbi:MAG: polysaccharide biosynthesis tyrosine autokinase [Ancrocorticia sp.]
MRVSCLVIEVLILELRDYLLIIRKRWIVILVASLLGLGLSALWSVTRVPIYEAKTHLFVSVRSGESSIGDMSQGSSFARQSVSSYASVVNDAIVMDRVVDELDLSLTPEELAEQVNADSPANTVLVNISVTDPDPEQAALIANKTSEVFADVVSNRLERTAKDAPARVQVDTTQPARVPDAPISPHLKMNLALGLLAGLVSGVGLAILRSVLDTKIRSKADIEALTDLPVVGTIGKDPDSQKRPLVALKDPRNPLVESFRTLRTNLSYLNVEDEAKTFVVTSAGPNEGKTTTAMNLAVVLADSGARVALVDADLRKPSVAKALDIEGAVGLSDLLVGKASLNDVLQQFGRQQLFVMPSGRIPPNPSELLGHRAMGKVLDMLSAQFDYVIIDTPPVLAVTDAAILSKHAGGAVMIAASGRVRKQDLSNAIDALHTVGGKVLGIVATMVPTKGPDAYSYGSYSYQYYGKSTVKDSGRDLELGLGKDDLPLMDGPRAEISEKREVLSS